MSALERPKRWRRPLTVSRERAFPKPRGITQISSIIAKFVLRSWSTERLPRARARAAHHGRIQRNHSYQSMPLIGSLP